MSWTKPPRIGSLRVALIASLACASLCACAGWGPGQTAPAGAKAQVEHAETPLDQYAIAVSPHPEQLALGVHASGLSPNQRAALAAYAAHWRESGTEVITVQAPLGSPCGCDPRTEAREAASVLSALGVPPALLRVGDYEAGAAAAAPVLVRYESFHASTADCDAHWGNLSSSYDNGVSSHFACAVTSNLAAMVADPRDLVRPTPMDPADGLRRSYVLDKYRQGQVTSSAKDDQAKGAVSQTVN